MQLSCTKKVLGVSSLPRDSYLMRNARKRGHVDQLLCAVVTPPICATDAGFLHITTVQQLLCQADRIGNGELSPPLSHTECSNTLAEGNSSRGVSSVHNITLSFVSLRQMCHVCSKKGFYGNLSWPLQGDENTAVAGVYF